MKSISIENNQVIVTDETTNKRTVHEYCMKTTTHDVVNLYTDMHIGDIRKEHKKDVITALWLKAGNQLGTSVAQFTKMLNGACYKAYIKDNEAMHNRFGISHGKTTKGVILERMPLMVGLVNDNIATINKYLADGNDHLAGFSFMFGEAHEAKKTLGKGLWKKLNKNSKSRNDLICKATGYHKIDGFDIVGFIGMLNRTPSTILGQSDSMNTMLNFFNIEKHIGMSDVINKTIKHIGGPMYKMNSDHLLGVTNLVRDTHRMHDAFNAKWSVRRIIREHDVAVKAQFAREHSPKEFGWVKGLTHVYEEKGIKAELCCSAYEIATLGKDQGHCVGSYAKFSMDARYVVFKITDAEGIVSTLGLRHPKETDLMDQHYLKYNRPVTNGACLVFVSEITAKIKKEMLPIEITVSEKTYGGFGANRHQAPMIANDDLDNEIQF
jgi:hypothetical protein